MADTDSKPQHIYSGIKEAYELSKKTGECPICPFCLTSLVEIREHYVHIIAWRWDNDKREYIVDDTGFETQTPYCVNCGAKSDDFCDNDLVPY